MPSFFPLPKWLYEPLLFLLSVILLIGAAEQCLKEMGQPLLLTAPNEKMPMDICFNSQDQCMPQPGREDIKSYGLAFARRWYNGTCPKGLLVCYESQLNPRSTQTGLVTDPRHGVFNLNGNLVARLCRTFRQKYIRENGKKTFEVPQWHGLLVNTTGKDEDGGFGIQLSYTNRTYTIKAEQQFKLLFGNKDDLRTNVSTMDEYGHYSEPKMLDEALANAYFRDAQRGAKLKRYAGLWSLGVDMMPHESKNSFKVKVFERSDNEEKCMLDAWFTFPTDERHWPEMLTTTTTEAPKLKKIYKMIGKTGTETNLTRFSVALKNPDASSNDVSLLLEIDDKISITTFNDGQNCTENYRCFPAQDSLSVFYCSDERGEQIRFAKPDELAALPRTFSNADVHIDIQVRHYSVSIFKIEFKFSTGDEFFYKNFPMHWPANWWNGLNTEKLIAKPIGEFKIISSDMQVEPDDNMNKLYQDLISRRLKEYNSRKFLQDFTVGSTLTFRAMFIRDVKMFVINFLRNTPQANDEIGDTVMQIRIDFTSETIVFKSRVNGKMSNNTTPFYQLTGSLELMVPFECRIEAIQVGNESKLKVDLLQDSAGFSFAGVLLPVPHWAINFFNIFDGVALLLLNEPILEFQPEQPRHDRMTLKSHMQVGDKIQMEIIPEQSENEIYIYLLHGVNEYNSKIGDVPLRIKFDYEKAGSGKVLVTASSLNRKRDAQEFENEVPTHTLVSAKGLSITLTIIAEEEKFIVIIGEENLTGSFPYTNSGMLPWTVDHISVSGTMPLSLTYHKSETPGDLPYTSKFDVRDFKEKKKIQIAMQLKTGEGDVAFFINFLNGGMYWDKYVVQTILRLEFNHENITTGAIIDGEVLNRKEESFGVGNSIAPEINLELDIEILKDGYKLNMRDPVKKSVLVKCPPFLPPWFIEYMSVEGNVKLNGKPKMAQN